MSDRTRAIALIVIQCLIVSSIGARYLYERVACPRGWVQVGQYDPNLPMRGRYLALSPLVDACSLPRDDESKSSWAPYQSGRTVDPKAISWNWRVITKAQDGKLVVENARHLLPRSDTQNIWLTSDQDCHRAQLSPAIDFFIPDTARSPFPLKQGTELWAEVTVPPKGPPRPIQLALSADGQWTPLKLK